MHLHSVSFGLTMPNLFQALLALMRAKAKVLNASLDTASSAAADGNGGNRHSKRRAASGPPSSPTPNWDEDDEAEEDRLLARDEDQDGGRPVCQPESLYAHAVVLELTRELQPDVLLGWAPLASAVAGAAR